MTLLEFAPQTPIEHRILAAQKGELSGDQLLHEIAASDLFIPSQDDVQEDVGAIRGLPVEPVARAAGPSRLRDCPW